MICAYFAEYLHRLSLYETELMEELSKTEGSSAYSGKTILEVVDRDFSLENLKDTTLGEVKEEILLEEKKILGYNQHSADTAAINTLDLTNARAYAKKYYSSYNPLYPRYTNDYTNFVSQILQAGGRRQVSLLTTSTLISDTKYWFIKRRPGNTFSRSSSWTVVTDLYSHLVRTQGAYTSTSKTNIINNAKSGDVIQFKKAGADRYSHAMWIYEKTSSDLKLSGHTSDYWDRSFNAIAYESYCIVKM